MRIVGPRDGDYYEEVDKFAKRHDLSGSLEHTGMLKGAQLAEAFAGVDIAVVPSYHENFGRVAVEAVANGTPVFVSDEVAVKDWVREEDVGSVLPLDADAWAAKIAEASEIDIRKRWPPRRLRRAVERHFSIERVGAQMMEQYRRVLG